MFDQGQTDPIEGHLQPEPVAHRLTGDDPAAIYGRTAAVMTARGWTVTREIIEGETNGYTTTDGTRRIVVDARLAPAQAAKTMLHEAAHALVHAADTLTAEDRRDLHRGRMEVEAESVAYVLAGILGLDTAAYSVGYVAGWANGDTDAVADTARAVLATVHELADALDHTDTADSAADDRDTADSAADDGDAAETAAA